MLQLFECCEHEEKCIGLPDHVYSPWNCLGKDPFYSCNQVYDECINSEDGDCKKSLKMIEQECPRKSF